MNPTKLLADNYVSILRLFEVETRADADRLLSMYTPWLRMHDTSVEAADELRHLVLARFPGDPEPVPGLDFAPEVVAADAAVIVAETLTDVTVADKQRSVRPGEHAEKMVVYRGEHSGWVGICVCGHQTAFYADRVSAVLHLSSHIVKATELSEVVSQPTAEAASGHDAGDHSNCCACVCPDGAL